MNLNILEKIVDTSTIQQPESIDITSFCTPPKKIVDITKMPKLQTKEECTWFDLPTPKITPEIKRDLLALSARSALDPKRHFKRDSGKMPKKFQMGVIVEPKAEYFSHRLTKKQRKSNLFEEMLKDPSTQSYLARKCKEIHARNQNNSTFRKKKQNKF